VPHSAAKTPVYVTHQSLHDHLGGATSVTAWVMQALAARFDVHLATPEEAVDFQRIDEIYGTSLAQAQISLHPLTIPGWLRQLPSRQLKSLRLAAAFRDPFLQLPDGVLIFNTANEMSFAGNCANYVHCPIRHPRMVGELCTGPQRWARLVNNAMFKVVSGFDEEVFCRSTCIANSSWTAAALHRMYGLDACVIYPPVTPPADPPMPLQDRSAGFVSIGRIAAEKRTDEAIEVIDELRRRGRDAHLHIVGTGAGPFARRIEAEVQRRPYMSLHGEISRAALADLLNQHRFGLHMMRNEHFGMAVAEMTAAGLLVLAHRSAGPMEILGAASPLLFTNVEEAVETADRLLASRALQEEYMADVAARNIGSAFSPQTFMRSILQVAGETLQAGGS
jgi:glycosyltransferase involved in cell wall biosynthesis